MEAHVADAAERYEKAAVDHGKYIKNGNSAACNRAYDRMHRALKELRTQPDRGETTLLGLVKHPDESVRVAAATHLLSLKPDVAIPVLERVASGSGLVAFDAFMVLKEWRKGRLKLE
jgi:hypothetical protein